jgi:hypothetical protein
VGSLGCIQRAKLAYEGKAKTPVTAESFAKWKAEKAEQKKKENAEKVARELAKKAKGKGLSVLSGKALFEYDATLFVDDEEADASGVDVSKVRRRGVPRSHAMRGCRGCRTLPDVVLCLGGVGCGVVCSWRGLWRRMRRRERRGRGGVTRR